MYPEWWNSDITIYNKYINPLTDLITWYKTQISGAFWKNISNRVILGNTTLETNSLICRIRKDEHFLPKQEWNQLPNDEMNDYFTLAEGDIVIKGFVDDNIDEYTQGNRSNDLINKYKSLGECIVINEISLNDDDTRGLMHYSIKGL